MIVLQHLTGPLAGSEARSRNAEICIGRDDGNEVVLRGPKISKVHARIRFQDNWYEVVDENSLNGTWLNDEGARLEGPRRLREHDVIHLGGPDGPALEVRFEYDRSRYTASQRPARTPVPTIWLVMFATMAIVTVGLVAALIVALRG